MPPQFVFSMSDVRKEYDAGPVLDGINLSFYYGAKIGVVGENGAGKSTLLRIMAGLDRDFLGEARLTEGMRVGYVPQEPMLDAGETVRENLDAALRPMHEKIERFEDISARMGECDPDEMDALMEEMTALQEEIDAADGWELDRQVDIMADALVLPPDDAKVDRLSGGERRRVALCRILLEKPDLLLLDEPTNHLDAETIAWLEATLREYPGTVIIVTHDRYFLDNITRWILELENGRGIPYEGNYSSWLEQKAERLRLREKKETERQRILKQELDWIHTTPKGRLTKSRDRVKRYEELATQSFEPSKSDVVIQIPPGPRLGEVVLECKGVTKGYDGVPLLRDVEFSVPRGAIVGVVGPNGVGKTTLFRMIVGEEQPDAGEMRLGPTVVLSYVDQHRDALQGDNTVFEEIGGGQERILLADRPMNARAYVARFNFRGQQQQKKVGRLSGGERNRVHLAKLLRTGGNLLLLDEPTNDLDINTMRVLESALATFPACAMVISHDRFFLDRICTHLLVFEGDGQVRWFDGNFQSYEETVLQERSDSERGQRRNRYKRLPR